MESDRIFPTTRKPRENNYCSTSTQKPVPEFLSEDDFFALKCDLKLAFDINLERFQNSVESTEHLLKTMKQLFERAIELRLSQTTSDRENKALLEDKDVLERQVAKKEEINQRLIEQFKSVDASFKLQVETLTKEIRGHEIKRQALENDFKRFKNEAKEKSFTVIKNSIKSGLFISGGAKGSEVLGTDNILRIENKGLLEQVQAMQNFKKEFYVNAKKLNAEIEKEFEVRRLFLIESLKMEGFDFSYFEVLKNFKIEEEMFFNGENASILLEKCSKMNKFYRRFDRILSAKFQNFDREFNEVVQNPVRFEGRFERFISNDFSKIGDTIFLQNVVQNFRDVTSEHMHLLKISNNVDQLGVALRQENETQKSKSMFNEYYDYRTNVNKIVGDMKLFMHKAELNKEREIGNQTEASFG